MIADDYISPDWQGATPIHDWRNYASDELKSTWDSYSDEQRKIIAECLQGIADGEDWD